MPGAGTDLAFLALSGAIVPICTFLALPTHGVVLAVLSQKENVFVPPFGTRVLWQLEYN